MKRLAPVVVVIAAAVLAATSFAAASTVVTGTVGPGFTITLKVKTLKAGTYTFRITDKSSFHDFHLIGPGVNKVITTVRGTGTKQVTLKLRKGIYRYVCDPHATSMRGTLKVT